MPVRVSSEARGRRLHAVCLDVGLVHHVQAQAVADLWEGRETSGFGLVHGCWEVRFLGSGRMLGWWCDRATLSGGRGGGGRFGSQYVCQSTSHDSTLAILEAITFPARRAPRPPPQHGKHQAPIQPETHEARMQSIPFRTKINNLDISPSTHTHIRTSSGTAACVDYNNRRPRDGQSIYSTADDPITS